MLDQNVLDRGNQRPPGRAAGARQEGRRFRLIPGRKLQRRGIELEIEHERGKSLDQRIRFRVCVYPVDQQLLAGFGARGRGRETRIGGGDDLRDRGDVIVRAGQPQIDRALRRRAAGRDDLARQGLRRLIGPSERRRRDRERAEDDESRRTGGTACFQTETTIAPPRSDLAVSNWQPSTGAARAGARRILPRFGARARCQAASNAEPTGPA